MYSLNPTRGMELTRGWEGTNWAIVGVYSEILRNASNTYRSDIDLLGEREYCSPIADSSSPSMGENPL